MEERARVGACPLGDPSAEFIVGGHRHHSEQTPHRDARGSPGRVLRVKLQGSGNIQYLMYVHLCERQVSGCEWCRADGCPDLLGCVGSISSVSTENK